MTTPPQAIITTRYVRNNRGIVGRVISDHPARGRLIVEVLDGDALVEANWYAIDTTDTEAPDHFNGYADLIAQGRDVDQDGGEGKQYSRGELVELIEDLAAALRTTTRQLAGGGTGEERAQHETR
jgi:hypothetical protein